MYEEVLRSFAVVSAVGLACKWNLRSKIEAHQNISRKLLKFE